MQLPKQVGCTTYFLNFTFPLARLQLSRLYTYLTIPYNISIRNIWNSIFTSLEKMSALVLSKFYMYQSIFNTPTSSPRGFRVIYSTAFGPVCAFVLTLLRLRGCISCKLASCKFAISCKSISCIFLFLASSILGCLFCHSSSLNEWRSIPIL